MPGHDLMTNNVVQGTQHSPNRDHIQHIIINISMRKQRLKNNEVKCE